MLRLKSKRGTCTEVSVHDEGSRRKNSTASFVYREKFPKKKVDFFLYIFMGT